MKAKKYAYSILCSLFVSILWLVSCSDKNEGPLKYVDLRFLAEDTYSLSAKSPEIINLQVKSTDPWEVYNTNSSWVKITPNKGEANQLYDVEVTYTENTELDDRIDTLTIKSDFWIGKEILVRQKGIAFLTVTDADDIVLSKDVDTYTFNVISNQNWSAKVKEGAEWLSVQSGAQGSMNGSVTVATDPNKGELRFGSISIYDRHNVEQAIVQVTQNGVQLDPEIVYLRTDHTAHQVRINVISNAEWNASKEDENLEWYSFVESEFNGNQTLVVNLDENTGLGVRTATIVLSTKPSEGSTPVTKTIVLKQANNNAPIRYEFNQNEASKWSVNQGSPVIEGDDVKFTGSARYFREGFEIGFYSFRIKSMSSDAYSRIFITQGSAEIRWHVDGAAKRTFITPTPWRQVRDAAVDITQPFTIGVNITESETPNTIDVEYFLNGVSFQKITGFAINPSDRLNIFLGGSAGTVVYDWYEYAAPIQWGD